MTDLDNPKEWDSFNKEMDKRESPIQIFLLDWLLWSGFTFLGLCFVILFLLLAYAIVAVLAHSGLLMYLLGTAMITLAIGIVITLKTRNNKCQ